MSLSGVLGNALSGMNAAQVGLRAASNNVANVNTEGYARTNPTLVARNVGGTAMGVQVAGVNRITDQFLQTASLAAISQAGQAEIVGQTLDRVQTQFGSLDDPGSLFSRLDTAFASISQASVDPTLAVSRVTVTADLQSFLDEAERLSTEIQAQRREADGRISTNINRANEIISELFELNSSVQAVSVGGGDTSGAANRQSILLDELSGILDINATTQSDGRLVLRTGDGVLLMDSYPLTLTYAPGGQGGYSANYGKIYAEAPNGQRTELDAHLATGELRGLIELRDNELPAMAEELGELTAGAADAINKAHNDSSAYPALNTLTGRNTGLEGTDLHNFTGATTLAVTDSSGALVSRVDIDFDAGTLSVDGGAAAAIGTTVDSLTTAINTALGANGTASFTNGVMEISAANGANGVAFLQDETSPSSRGGRGFSHFFGLNDLIDSSRPGFFETGMNGADAHGFTAGQTLTYDITSADGATIASVSIPMVAGETFADVVTDLNDTTNGVGRWVTFAFDGNGQLSATPNAGYENVNVALSSDDTARANSGVSMSQLFGMSLDAKAGRSSIFEVNPDIRSNGSLLALAKLDIDAATTAGDIVLTSGDNRGGIELNAVAAESRMFSAAGGFSATSTSLQDYSARFAGMVGTRALRALNASESAVVLKETAALKRADVEGVNLDEELAAMTMYQQSYNAAARMLQAAKEMTDALMSTI